MLVKALIGQTFWDIAIQYTGRVEAAFDIAAANDLACTDEFDAETTLTIPNTIERNDAVSSYFQGNGYRPATSVEETEIEYPNDPDIEFEDTGVWDDVFDVTFY